MTLLECLTPLQKTEIVFKIIESIATALAIIVGGIWALFRFRRQRENYALIDFTVDIKFHKNKGEWWIVELLAFIENKGKVRQEIELFDFELASINDSDKVDISKNFGGQVLFPNIICKGSFLPKQSKYFFIEPGLKNKYSFISRVPIDSEIVLLHSWFNYLDGIHSHAAEKTLKVPKPKRSY